MGVCITSIKKKSNKMTTKKKQQKVEVVEEDDSWLDDLQVDISKQNVTEITKKDKNAVTKKMGIQKLKNARLVWESVPESMTDAKSAAFDEFEQIFRVMYDRRRMNTFNDEDEEELLTCIDILERIYGEEENEEVLAEDAEKEVTNK